ncbi:MAG: hypothetical protein D6785_11695 [Planctomycetota bacterium]|nr:MAG: hypothetical protein D6785_11695 [Planctomycetota bacterium]
MEKQCSFFSKKQKEPIQGTAPYYESYLLIEAPLPWPRKIYGHPLLPKALKSWVKEKNSCPLLIVNNSSQEEGPYRLFFFSKESPQKGRMTKIKNFSELEKALEMDSLFSLLTKELEEPVFLVCTHGFRDSCCGSLGIPFFLQLEEEIQKRNPSSFVFRSSHVGGHRFAVNLLIFPEARLYGRLHKDIIPEILEDGLKRNVLKPYYRGCAYLSPPCQMAEIWAREQGMDISSLGIREDGEWVYVEGEVKGETQRFRLNISQDSKPLRVLGSCGDKELKEVYPLRIEKIESVL